MVLFDPHEISENMLEVKKKAYTILLNDNTVCNEKTQLYQKLY